MPSAQPGTVVMPTGQRKLLNCCKRYCIPESVGKFIKVKGRYVFHREGWQVPAEAYAKARKDLHVKLKIISAKQKARPKAFELVQVLRRLFTANANAKNCIKRSTRDNAYTRKNGLLRKAIALARETLFPGFKWGIKFDTSTPGYEIVVYFQFGDDYHSQVSFHTDYTPECPAFYGEWNHIFAECFPLSIPALRAQLKAAGLTVADILAQESSNPHDPRPCISFNNRVAERRAIRDAEHQERWEERRWGGWRDDFDEDQDNFL